MSNTKRMFKVSICDEKKTAGVRVHLPVLRSEDEVENLRRAYANVMAHAVETPGVDVTADLPEGSFRGAIRALAACYRKAEDTGNHQMSARAQAAMAALLGYQPQLETDSGEAFGAPPAAARTTLTGIGAGRFEGGSR